MFLSNTTILFDGRGVFILLRKVQLHVSALGNSRLQVVHESLESSYTRFNMGCVQWGDLVPTSSPTSPLFTAHIESCITTF